MSLLEKVILLEDRILISLSLYGHIVSQTHRKVIGSWLMLEDETVQKHPDL